MEPLNEKVLQEHLLQYAVNYIPNPSDESDFEDTTYEADLQYEKEKKEQLARKEEIKILIEKKREEAIDQLYYALKEEERSILTLPGLKFKRFTHKVISFEFHADAIDKKYIPKSRVYHVVLKYVYNRWVLRRYHVPDRTLILAIYLAHKVTDEYLIDFIHIVYTRMEDEIHKEVASRREKHQRFLLGEDVELNSDDELAFFNEAQRKARKRKIDEIWARMLPPKQVQVSKRKRKTVHPSL